MARPYNKFLLCLAAIGMATVSGCAQSNLAQIRPSRSPVHLPSSMDPAVPTASDPKSYRFLPPRMADFTDTAKPEKSLEKCRKAGIESSKRGEPDIVYVLPCIPVQDMTNRGFFPRSGNDVYLMYFKGGVPIDVEETSFYLTGYSPGNLGKPPRSSYPRFQS